ncbi:hypothetical protein CKAN_01383900 [Cinnamomum micranthum f. kanehirae]|uniref:Uncharacterized protein n=1 Tax=Cinnamomum micranthum f. kanehirae TaxID=337451 RepID=A0A443P2P3_9MAGN|nr:hypothetical protein CKAN_01383900 [Cinnamomum micranthum f. kanehirae]
MTNPAAADGYWGVPELRGDASVPGPDTDSSSIEIVIIAMPDCPYQHCSAPGASGGDRSGSSRRSDRVESAGYHLIGYPSAIGTLDICFGEKYF